MNRAPDARGSGSQPHDAARAEILERIRTALGDAPVTAPVDRDYRTQAGAGDIDVFVDRLEDYRATVHRSDGPVGAALTSILTARGRARVAVPDGFPQAWLPDLETVHEPVTVDELDRIGAVITTCRAAVAETGTIVLDAGPGMGARALSLVPDYHLVVVQESQVLAGVPDAVAAVDPARPLTWISGPSASSDIELNRVEGVHGPRTLDVLVLSAQGDGSS